MGKIGMPALATRDNALAVGLDGEVGEVAEGKLADIAILQDAKNLAWVIKDGKIVDLYPRDEMLVFQQAAE